jgi:hypothetical protein
MQQKDAIMITKQLANEVRMDSLENTPLATDILASLAILNRGAESVSAVMSTEENRFSRALADLQRLAITENIPIAVVGGLGAIRYGYPAATQAIDIAIAQHQLEALVRTAPPYGFKVLWEAPSGWHTLTHGDVEINVVPEGGKAKNSSPTTIPSPAQLGVGQGLDYASLQGWIELKLSSGRQKDRAHIVEVMKKTADDVLHATRQHIASVHESYLQLFDRLLEEARDERAQEDERR